MTSSTHLPKALLASLAALLALTPVSGQTPFAALSSRVLVAGVSASADASEPAEPSVVKSGVRPPATLLDKDSLGRELSSDTLTPGQKAVREADRHFQFGKFFLQEGKTVDARHEFDLAIDCLLDLPEDAPDRAAVEKKFEELVRLIQRYDVDSLGSGVSQEQPVFVQSTLPEILDLTFPIDPSLRDKTLAQVAAASSQLPLSVNDAVLSYINYFTSPRGRRVLEYGWKHSGRYRPMISRILAEEGVPQELIHLAQAESGFVPRAISRAAAAGMWQFVRSRGTEYGLLSTPTTDDRLDPEKATRAAARHLRDLYTQLGDWYLAMAAYNCGPYCVERAVQRTGFADFWELRARSVLPKETMNYVPAILAMAIVSKNPQAYGIEFGDMDPELEYDTVKMAAPTGLALLADAADLPVSELRDLNPAILRSQVPAGFEVRVPKARGNAVLAALDVVPVEKRSSWRLHRVAQGDTLASIARRYSTATNSILMANAHLDNTFFEAPPSGEMVLIPAAPAPEPVKRTPTKARATAPAAHSNGTARTAAGHAPAHATTNARVAMVAHTNKPVKR